MKLAMLSIILSVPMISFANPALRTDDERRSKLIDGLAGKTFELHCVKEWSQHRSLFYILASDNGSVEADTKIKIKKFVDPSYDRSGFIVSPESVPEDDDVVFFRTGNYYKNKEKLSYVDNKVVIEVSSKDEFDYGFSNQAKIVIENDDIVEMKTSTKWYGKNIGFGRPITTYKTVTCTKI